MPRRMRQGLCIILPESRRHMPPLLQTLRRIDIALLCAAMLVTAIAVSFYWSQPWIHFSVAAVPSIALSFLPYLIHAFGSHRPAAKIQSRSAVASSLAGGTLLLTITCVLYLPFLDSGLVFYLRWGLGLAIPLLGVVASFFALLTWLLVRRVRRMQSAVEPFHRVDESPTLRT